jgi:hypothetical protein
VNFNAWNNCTVVPPDSDAYPAFQASMIAKLARFQEQVGIYDRRVAEVSTGMQQVLVGRLLRF